MIKLAERAVESRAEDYFDSDTFTPTGRKLGRGCWSSVNEYEDAVGQRWAIKGFSPNETARKQMKERGWSREDVMRREAIPLNAAHRHVVPRLIERDKKGKMYVAMPVYEDRDLSDRLHDLKLGEALIVTGDIADALSYAHERKDEGGERIAHGDVKPSNIFMKDGRAFLSDWGSATCISIGDTGSKRGPHGDKNYRAPECSGEGAKPSSRADIWSLGAILYEAISKQGIYDGLSDAERRKQHIISEKIRKKIPRPFRKFLEKSLSVDPDKRYTDGIVLKQGLEKARRKYERSTLPSRLKRYGAIAAAAIVLAGASAAFVNFHNTSKDLGEKVVQLNENAETRKRREVINLYLQRNSEKDLGKSFSYPYDLFSEDGKLSAALFKFKDKKVGLAAYLNPDDVFAAIMDAGLDPDSMDFNYKTIEPFLRERNSNAYWEIWEVEHNYQDSFLRRLRSDKMEEFNKEWGQAKVTYKQKQIEAERAKHKALERQKKIAKTEEIVRRIK